MHCKDAKVSGLAVDLTGGVRTVAVFYTGEWIKAGAASPTRFAACFTLMPPAAAGEAPKVKNHIHRSASAAPTTPTNVPPTHSAVSDFVGKYFAAFDSTVGDARSSTLSAVHADAAVMSFEGEDYTGKAQIIPKLATLPATKHSPTTVDVHPISPTASVALVCGSMSIDGGAPLLFNQAIFVAAAPAGSPTPIVIVGDVFQFNYG